MRRSGGFSEQIVECRAGIALPRFTAPELLLFSPLLKKIGLEPVGVLLAAYF